MLLPVSFGLVNHVDQLVQMPFQSHPDLQRRCRRCWRIQPCGSEIEGSLRISLVHRSRKLIKSLSRNRSQLKRFALDVRHLRQTKTVTTAAQAAEPPAKIFIILTDIEFSDQRICELFLRPSEFYRGILLDW